MNNSDVDFSDEEMIFVSLSDMDDGHSDVDFSDEEMIFVSLSDMDDGQSDADMDVEGSDLNSDSGLDNTNEMVLTLRQTTFDLIGNEFLVNLAIETNTQITIQGNKLKFIGNINKIIIASNKLINELKKNVPISKYEEKMAIDLVDSVSVNYKFRLRKII
jgi:hypothetical protein